MHVISKKKIIEAGTEHPDWMAPLENWYSISKKAHWQHFVELRQSWASADVVGECVVFDIGGNKCRLIAKVYYEHHTLLIRFVLSHADYDKEGWKNDCGC